MEDSTQLDSQSLPTLNDIKVSFDEFYRIWTDSIKDIQQTNIEPLIQSLSDFNKKLLHQLQLSEQKNSQSDAHQSEEEDKEYNTSISDILTFGKDQITSLLTSNEFKDENLKNITYHKILATQRTLIEKVKALNASSPDTVVFEEFSNFLESNLNSIPSFSQNTEQIKVDLNTGENDSATTKKSKKKAKKSTEKRYEEENEAVTVKRTMIMMEAMKDTQVASVQGLIQNENTVTQRRANYNQIGSLSKEDTSSLKFYKQKRIICSEIFDIFKEDFQKNRDNFIKNASKNQVVKQVDHKNFLSLDTADKIKKYIEDNGYNYNIIEDLTKIAQGGEAQIFRLKVIQPVETIVKIPVQQKSSLGTFLAMQGLLMESHLLKLIAHKEYIAEILEEIIEYNEKEQCIYGCVVIVEQAQNDLNDIISFWKDKNQSREKQEKFSPEKLAYFCLKAMEAINYVHSRNVYFGDMKPENLLVFRDLTVKLGDFGVSIKIPDDAKPDDLFDLKGLTNFYSMPEILEKFRSQVQVTYRELILNDYYCLWKTFRQIQKNLKFKLPKECFFNEMVSDLFKMTQEEFNLNSLLNKWKKIIGNSNDFILELCDQMIEEDKIKAIPNILKLSKYKNIFEGLFDIFKRSEDHQFTYVQEKQYQEIEEDNAKSEQNDQRKEQDFEIYVQKSIFDEAYIQQEIESIEKFISKLFYYKDPLDHNFYKQTIYKMFVKYYQSITFNVNIWNNERQFQKDNLKSIFDGKKELFKRYATFYFFTSHSINDVPKLQLLISLAKEYECQDLELSMLKRFIQTYYNADEHNKTNRYDMIKDYTQRIIQICKLQDKDYFPAIECLILQCVHGLQLKYIQESEFKAIISQIKSLKSYKLSQYESFYSKLHRAKALNEQNKQQMNQEIIIKYLQKERALYSKFFGEQGEEMSRNAYNLYEAYQKFPSDEQSLYYLQKVANYSRIEKKMIYSFKLAQYYKIRNQKVKLIECLKLFQKIDYILYFIFFYYYGITSELSKQEKQKCITKLRNQEEFLALKATYFDKIKIFQKGILTLFGSKKKDYDKILDIYKKWSYKVDLKEIQQFNIKSHLLMKNLEEYQSVSNKDLLQIELTYQSGTSYSGQIKNWKLNGIGTMKFFNKSIYEGEFKSNMIHGKGQLTTENGKKYIGVFEEGEFKEGELHITNKEKYIGEFDNKRYHGKGKLIKEDGQVFEGVFYENQFIQGKITKPNGDTYDGSSKDLKYEGKGLLMKSNGDKYEGSFANNQFVSGKVEIKTDNNNFYKGDYQNGQYNGQGYLQKGEDFYEGKFTNNSFNEGKVSIKNSNGNLYVGEYSNNNYHGEGKLQEKDGNIYEGKFNQGKFLKGKVKITSINGEIYEGEYSDNMKNGYGILTEKGGIKLEGNWKSDKLEGPGKYHLQTGEIYEGLYQNSQFISGIKYTIKGDGIIIQENGDVYNGNYENGKFTKGKLKSFLYDGEIENDLKHGKGKLIISTNSFYEGEFKEDLFHGEGVLTTQFYRYEGCFEKNLENGIGKITFINGSTFQGNFQNGIGEGEFIGFNDQKFQGYFQKNKFYSGVQVFNGLLNGTGIVIKDNGDFYDGTYEHDIFMNGKCITKEYEGDIVDGRKEGFGVLKNVFGKIYEGEWIMNKYNGRGKRFYFGNVELEGQFLNGKPIKDCRVKLYDGQEYFIEQLQGQDFSSGSLTEGSKNQWKGFKYSQDGVMQYGLFENGVFKEGWVSDHLYTGEMKNGDREGNGQILHENYIFQGAFVGGKRNGDGISVNNHGRFYKGCFQNDLIHNYGTFIHNDGTELSGEFKAAEIQQNIFVKLMNGVSFNGQFENQKCHIGSKVKGCFQGPGLMIAQNIVIQFGEFEQNEFKKGTQLSWNYLGGYENNNYHSNGSLYGDQQLYFGEFQNGKKCNQGMLINKIGEIYSGNWQNDQKNGFGVLVKANGQIYRGEFIDNEFEGQGELSYKEKLSLIGEFKRGNFIQGAIKFEDTTYTGIQFEDHLYFGIFENETQFNGEGFCLVNGQEFIYKGQIVNNQRHGKGKLYYFSGQISETQFKNDKMNSQVSIYKWYQRFGKITPGYQWNSKTGQKDSITFSPKININVVGFGLFEKLIQKPFNFKWRYRLLDEAGCLLEEMAEFKEEKVTYDEEINNKMIKFIFQREQGPIKVMAYQQITIIIEHQDDKPHFFAEDGNNYKLQKNVDSECFEIKVSSFSELSTNISQGQIPGLIYY